VADRSDHPSRGTPGSRGSRTGRPTRPQPSDIPGGTAIITRDPAEPRTPGDVPGDRAVRPGRTFTPYAYARTGAYPYYRDYAPHDDPVVPGSVGDCGSAGWTGRRLTGGLQLQVQPVHAQVFVDGCGVGTVEDFDSVLQRLRLPEGSHWLDIWAEGYSPLSFEVRIRVGETVSYPGALRPLRPIR